MTNDLRPNLDQPCRSHERRRLAPYFLAAILIHLTVLIYKTREESSWQAVPMGTVSLTLGQTTPTHAVPPQAVAKPLPVIKAPQKPEKIIAIPAKQPTPALTPPTVATASEPIPKTESAPSAATSNAATPANASSTPLATGSGNAVAISPPRFDAAYLLNPKPDYPPLSRRLGEEGKVLLKVQVNIQGLPTAVEIEKTSGFERLDDAARHVVTRWRFVPAKRGEQPIEAAVIVPISFRLEG